jgi:hypothetical protein
MGQYNKPSEDLVARLFIATERLDTWTGEGKATLEGSLMTLVELGRSFTIRPAVRFLSVTGADDDPHALLGKVKDDRELTEMGAEHMSDSVIYVDTAYDVQNGFVGEPVPK